MLSDTQSTPLQQYSNMPEHLHQPSPMSFFSFACPNMTPLIRKFSFRISVQRLSAPNSSTLILLILPLGFPMTTAFQSLPRPTFSRSLNSCQAAVSRLVPNVWFGMTCTDLKRQRTKISRTVRAKRMPAVVPVDFCAPRLRVMLPPTIVATAARMNAMI